MKILFSALALCLATAPAFAGGSVAYTNDALGFTLVFSKFSENGEICDGNDKCLTLEPVRSLTETKTLYREATGLCDVEIERFEQSFAQGRTKNDFMLTVSGQVVQVVKGEDKCKLTQTSMKQERSLTGIYQ